MNNILYNKIHKKQCTFQRDHDSLFAFEKGAKKFPL